MRQRWVGLELCLQVGMGQHFPQSWWWQVLERSQRSRGLPKWCYLKAQLFLQLLGDWGTLVVALQNLGLPLSPDMPVPEEKPPCWGERGGLTCGGRLQQHLDLNNRGGCVLSHSIASSYLGQERGLFLLGPSLPHTLGPLIPTPPLSRWFSHLL